MSKVILILLDGAGYDTMTASAGYLEHLVECGGAAKYKVRGELPAMSRPMYETILTGQTASRHGIITNAFTGPSQCENIFSLTHSQGLSNGAAAYYWISELYNRNGPFDIVNHRYQLDGNSSIEHGIFYFEDDYPDSHLFLDGEYLRKCYHPDFLFLHTMNADYHGHIKGSESREYRLAVLKAADFLSRLLPLWLEDGYDILVTADHGMDEWGMHSGNSDVQRDVPLYILSEKVEHGDFSGQPLSQLNIAPLCCFLLNIERGKEMIPLQNIKGGQP